jgi:hypothetical protein
MTKLQIIYDAVCTKTGLEIDTNTRIRKYIIGRGMYYQLARTLTTHRLTDIGAEIGKDHASVIHSLKHFERDITKDPHNFKIYNDLKKYLQLKMPEEIEVAINKDLLVHYVINLKAEIRDLKIKVNSTPIIEKLVIEPNKDPFIDQIINLDDIQSKIFQERAEIMLRSIKSIRTYENTHKREFNAA